MATVAQGSSANVTLTQGQSLWLNCGVTDRAIVEAVSGAVGPAGTKLADHRGSGVYQFGAGVVAVKAVSGSVDYETDYQAGLPGRVKTVSGTAWTVSDADDAATLVTSNASAVTMTVPAGLRKGFGCSVKQGAAGQVTFSAGSGVTITNVSSQTKTSGANGVVALVQDGAETYSLVGSTGA